MTMDLRKVPPQNIEAERSVLGGLLLDQEAWDEVAEIISEDDFYKPAHRKIFESIKDLNRKNEPTDLVTVSNHLMSANELDAIGGPAYLAEVMDHTPSSANIGNYAKIIRDKYLLRRVIKLNQSLSEKAFSQDFEDVNSFLDECEAEVFALTEQKAMSGLISSSDLIKVSLEKLEKLHAQKGQLTGVPSGFAVMDSMTAGFQPGELSIIAARPSMGKTAFTLSLARNAAVDHNIPVAFFSLEMSALQLVQRLISMEVELESDKLRKGNLKGHEWAQLNDRVTKIADAPIYIDDTPGINIFELRAKCRRLKMQYDIQMVVIDYLQLMSGTGDKRSGNREQEISAISRALKGVGKELNVPVIALSQLSRAVETRGGNKKPQLSDLRESGAIEQDADMVLFLYRPEYYGFDRDDEGNPTQGIAEVIIAKHRNGALDTVKTRFVGKFAKFIDYDVMQSVPDGFMSMSQAEEIATITMGSKLNNGGSSGVTTNVVPVDDGGDLPF